MATLAPELPAERETAASDLAGMFSFLYDPPAAAKRLFRKWFWVGPLILVSLASSIYTYILIPLTQHVMEVAPLPPNVTPEQYQRSMEISGKIQHVLVFCMPILTAIVYAIDALVLYGMCAMLSVRAKYRELFNLAAGCSVISALSLVAMVAILKAKGEVSTQAELRPALGFDIFLPEGSGKYLTAFLGYFSFFEIWWIVMACLVLSAAYRISKGKALMVEAPLLLLALGMRLLGAVFQR